MNVLNIFSLGELFEEVQMRNIFPDGKTFVDCTPALDLTEIKNLYNRQKSNPSFSLTNFVNEHFILPKSYSAKYKSVDGRPIVQHIELLWDELTRQPEKSNDSLIALPNAYIVPGGRFREIYYWDSYFTMLGLQVSGRIDMIRLMTENFSYLIDHTGYIPNGNRSYYIGRSQPPFYASIVKLLSEEDGKDVLLKYLPQLEKEYAFWMNGSESLNRENDSLKRVALLPGGTVLNCYRDENNTPRPESFKEDVELAENATDKTNMYRNLRAGAESGWDFSSRWFRDAQRFSSIHTTEIIPVDLNCLLFNLEQTLGDAYGLSNNLAMTGQLAAVAGKRKRAIDEYCWNSEHGFYFDYDYVERKQKRTFSLAACYPLFFNIASQEQSNLVAGNLRKRFLFPGGLITTTEDTGQQWDAPNGWAPLQWVAVKGLLNYGHTDLAGEIARRWMEINEKVYLNTGKMMEKYNVTDTALEAGGGEYPAQDGFGWTNGVYLALAKLFPRV